jgi:hypothetical protein
MILASIRSLLEVPYVIVISLSSVFIIGCSIDYLINRKKRPDLITWQRYFGAVFIYLIIFEILLVGEHKGVRQKYEEIRMNRSTNKAVGIR